MCLTKQCLQSAGECYFALSGCRRTAPAHHPQPDTRVALGGSIPTICADQEQIVCFLQFVLWPALPGPLPPGHPGQPSGLSPHEAADLALRECVAITRGQPRCEAHTQPPPSSHHQPRERFLRREGGRGSAGRARSSPRSLLLMARHPWPKNGALQLFPERIAG